VIATMRLSTLVRAVALFSEEKESFSPLRRNCLFDFGNMRQIPAFKRGSRILYKQRPSLLFAKLLRHHVISRLQPQRAHTVIVCVASHKMN